MIRKIRWMDKEWLLIGKDTGAITNKGHYRHGIISFAHLCEDGLITRHREVIGTKEDIEFLEEIPDIEPAEEAMGNMLNQMLPVLLK